MPTVIHKDQKVSLKIKQDMKLIELARRKSEVAPCFIEAKEAVARILSSIKQ